MLKLNVIKMQSADNQVCDNITQMIPPVSLK